LADKIFSLPVDLSAKCLSSIVAVVVHQFEDNPIAILLIFPYSRRSAATSIDHRQFLSKNDARVAPSIQDIAYIRLAVGSQEQRGIGGRKRSQSRETGCRKLRARPESRLAVAMVDLVVSNTSISLENRAVAAGESGCCRVQSTCRGRRHQQKVQPPSSPDAQARALGRVRRPTAWVSASDVLLRTSDKCD
jgi:hypothetical protein